MLDTSPTVVPKELLVSKEKFVDDVLVSTNTPVELFQLLDKQFDVTKSETLNELEGKIGIILGQLVKAHEDKLNSDNVQFSHSDRWAEGFVDGIRYVQTVINAIFNPPPKPKEVVCYKCEENKLSEYDLVYRENICAVCEIKALGFSDDEHIQKEVERLQSEYDSGS